MSSGPSFDVGPGPGGGSVVLRRRLATAGLVALVAVAGLAGCGGGGDAPPAAPSEVSVSEDTGVPAVAPAALTLKIQDAGGAAVLTADLAADGSGPVQGSLLGATAISAGPLRGGKRSWLLGGQPLADAKLEDSGKLKVKDPAGATLWVAKPSGADKTKVLQGEDTEVYSLGLRAGSPGEAKVKQGDQEVGSVKSRSSGGAKLERPDGTTSFSTDHAATPGLGLLLMDRVPPPLRAVLLVELVQRPPG